MTSRLALARCLAVTTVLLLTAGLAPAATLTVPGDYPTIQAAVDAAAPGDVIDIAAGTYVEQVRIATADLSLQGAGIDATIIESPAILPASFSVGDVAYFPVVFVDGATAVAMSGLTVDGAGQGTANDIFLGIGYWNGDGSLQDVRITRVREEPAGTLPCQAIYTNNDTGGPYSLDLDQVQVDDFQRVGINIRGTGMTGTVTSSSVTGAGEPFTTHQNGIQFSGATGILDGCTVTDMSHVGDFLSVGVVGFSGADVAINGTSIENCYIGAASIGSVMAADGCDFGGVYSDAIWVRSTAANARASDAKRIDGLPDGTEPTTRSGASGTITNCVATGADFAFSWGIHAAGPGTVELTVTGTIVENFQNAFFFRGDDPAAVIDATITENSVATSEFNYFSVDSASEGTVDIRASGNHLVGPPQDVSSRIFGEVDFSPWVTDGTDVSADPGLQLGYSVLHVDDRSLPTGDLGLIEEALQFSAETDTIIVEAGDYFEQVHVTRDGLTLRGRKGTFVETTYLRYPDSFSRSFAYEGADYYPIIFVDGATDVSIGDFLLTGDVFAEGVGRLVGVGYWNASGLVRDMNIREIGSLSPPDPYSGIGILAATDNTVGPLTVTCERDTVSSSAANRGGAVFLGEQLTGEVSGLVGGGIYNIEYGAGANGLVTDMTLAGSLVGVLATRAGQVDIDGVELLNNDFAVILEDGSASLSNSRIFTGLGGRGVQIVDTDVGPIPGLFQADPILPRETDRSDRTFTSMLVADSQLESAVYPSVYVGDGVNFELTGSTILSGQTAILLPDGGDVTGFINENDFSQTITSIEGSTLTPLDATCNWWGSVDGPNTPDNPSDGVNLESNVDFTPWLNAPGGECGGGVVTDIVTVTPPEDCGGDGCSLATVTFDRGNTDPLRGLSVTFTLSQELALCTGDPDADLTALTGTGAMFAGYENVTQEVIDNGGGSYTVDVVLTGDPCGPVTGGDVFTIALTAAEGAGDVTGTITVDAVDARDCDAQPLPAQPGPPAEVVLDGTPPAAITDLAVAPGEDGSTAGTKQVVLSWTAPTDPEAETIEIWRRGYGDHPEYDDGAGTPPTVPVSADNGWILVGTVAATASGSTDDPGARDFWSYAVKAVDACGNASPVAAEEIAGGILNYHLGDVVDPADTAAAGDNLVDIADVSRLGASYGTADGEEFYLNTLDIGPTADLGPRSLPTTDDLIDFEDLMVMATNFGMVGRLVPPDILAASGNAVAVDVVGTGPRPGTVTARITMQGDGRIQGLSVPLVWNADAVRPAAMSAGDLVAAQGGHGIVLSPEPGTVDAALLGTRDRRLGIRGEGVLATVVFERVGAGDPRIALGEVTARDVANKPLLLGASGGGGAHTAAGDTALPVVTALHPNHPNPFNPSTTLSFSLERAGRVQLGIYDVRGRLVRSLVDGPMARGEHALVWHGRNDAGQTVSSGTYFARMVTADRSQTRTITLVK